MRRTIVKLRELFRGGPAVGPVSAAQQGFTLVEMAIVLVIVGLLVGGILKGQEIVNNGRVKVQVAQIDAVKAAVQTFWDKFSFYPGDDPQASLQLGIDKSFNGDGNGIVATNTATPSADPDSTGEAASTEPNAVWYELQSANLLSGVETNSPGATASNTANFNMLGKMGTSYLTYADFSVPTGTGSSTANKMVRIAGIANPTVLTTANGPAMREQDAAQIDIKYDDGLPETGQILATSYSAALNCCGAGACTASTSSTYGLQNTANTAALYCALIWATQ